MHHLDEALEAADRGLGKSLERLFEFLRIPSISTDPAYEADCRKAAEWLVAELKLIGLFQSEQVHSNDGFFAGIDLGLTPRGGFFDPQLG